MNAYLRPLKICALLLAVALLGGCAAAIPIRPEADSTLPPPSVPFAAPLGDAGESQAQTVLLSLPSAKNGRLEYVQERVLVSHNRHPAEFTIRRLFSYSGTTQVAPLSQSAQLALNPGSSIEISGGTATVNLAPSALTLSNQERYLVSRAIANTLTQWGDIRAVNVLINGRHPGLDTAATMPMGSLGRSSDGDIASLWEAISRSPASNDSAYTGAATLYYPAAAGRGILATTATISAPSRAPADLTMALLGALSDQTGLPDNTPRVPDLPTLLSEEPLIEENAGSTGRVVRLAFHESMNEALISAGIPRSVMMAALTYTLTTFLPYTTGIAVTIGQEPIVAVVPAGLYEGAGEQILFDKGIMQRGQFKAFLLDVCTLYFANAQGRLSGTQRPIPYYQVYNPRYLLGQLMLGPQSTDSVNGLASVLPDELKDADLLGVTRQNDTMLVNFSGKLRDLAAPMDERQELLMTYALVNTLTWQKNASRVCLFLDGSQQGTLAGSIDLAGFFLRNEGIIQ